MGAIGGVWCLHACCVDHLILELVISKIMQLLVFMLTRALLCTCDCLQRAKVMPIWCQDFLISIKLGVCNLCAMPVASSTVLLPFSRYMTSTSNSIFPANLMLHPAFVEQKGSNPGGLFAHKADRSLTWYVKKLPTGDHAKNEVCGREGRHTGIFVSSRMRRHIVKIADLCVFCPSVTPLPIIVWDHQAKLYCHVHF